jgi:hypothetical protein
MPMSVLPSGATGLLKFWTLALAHQLLVAADPGHAVASDRSDG